MRKGQGTFEYVLLLAGVLLIVVLAIVLLRGGIFGGGAKDVALQSCKAELAKSACYVGGVWTPTNSVPIGDSCKAFVINYRDGGYVEQGDCSTVTTKDLKVDDVREPTIVCCGEKPA